MAKKTIFYFEDEPGLMNEYFEVLRKKYEVIVGANKGLIEKRRQQPIDLVILDLMIHHDSPDAKKNISYPDVKWRRTGVEFLRRIRDGDYEAFGFHAKVPVIVATVVVDDTTRKEVEQFGIKAYLKKPFPIDELEKAVNTVLGS